VERQDGVVEYSSADADGDGRAASPGKRERRGPPPQDLAVYSCACGYVFDAHVSTSVECPHCGQMQAW
jgi:hypothetical protein